MTSSNLQITLTKNDEIALLNEHITVSARELSRGFYTEQETESAITYVFGVDTNLVHDGCYFTARINDAIIGCGGWSRRRTMYGGDQRPVGDVQFLDPHKEAARIRAFFIAPTAARRGVGRAIYDACHQAASAAGFTALELMATLPGVPFYLALGFVPIEEVTDTLPDGVTVKFLRMRKDISSK
jgi:GNAT superfamily N-acetyltransferase